MKKTMVNSWYVDEYLKYTEIYFDDALRLAQFFAERDKQVIKPVEMDSTGFPLPAKGEEFGEKTKALIVGDYAIAYFRKRTSPDEDLRHRNKNLYRVQFGIKMQEARQRADVRLDELSAYTGIKMRNLENIENGRYDVSIDMIGNIASALGCTFDFVKDDND